MSFLRSVTLGFPTLLEFRGPDAVRFLNGQLTQDVRRVVGSRISLPSCVTDAKGKLQYRVTLTNCGDDALWVECPASQGEGLEARLTRYLIADDVEVADLTGKFGLLHLTGEMNDLEEQLGEIDGSKGLIVRTSNRFGVAGTDIWHPEHTSVSFDIPALEGDELEAFRIANGVPRWGRELVTGMLPPEACLETTDISYQKGCYIGQEVISRIKSAGKVNRRLANFLVDATASVVPGLLEDGAGEITSVSPIAAGGERCALGYVKRGAKELIYQPTIGPAVSVRQI